MTWSLNEYTHDSAPRRWRAPQRQPFAFALLSRVSRTTAGYRAKESPDLACTRVAASQFGLVTRAQAIGAGLTPDQIDNRLATARWRRLYRGVYAIRGVAVTWHQSLLAACLHAGPGSGASHRSAAVLWQLDGFSRSVIEITTPGRSRCKGAVVHRASLPRRDLGKLGGIPVTGVVRTLADLGAVSPERSVETALECALRRRIVLFDELVSRLDEVGGSGRRGAGVLRKLLDDRRAIATESELENLLERVLAEGGFLPPKRQLEVYDGPEFLGRLDFAYPERKLGIEAESYRWHLGKAAFEKDLARRNALVTRGWNVLYFTYGQMKRRRHEIWHDVGRALGQHDLFG